MPAAPLLDAALNDRGHDLACACERCLPPGADGAAEDAREAARAEKPGPAWARRPVAIHAMKRNLTAA